MRESTRTAASALLEDLDYTRKLLENQKPSAAEIRRFSGILRRIIVDDDLRKIAVPRIGKLLIKVPDVKPYVKHGERYPFRLLSITTYSLLGGRHSAIMEGAEKFPDFDTTGSAFVNTDGFRSQPVFQFFGTWVRRVDVIKHVAIHAHGVHSEQASDAVNLKIEEIRKCVYFSESTIPNTEQKVMALCIDYNATAELFHFEAGTGRLDLVLLQLLDSARLICESSDVIRLEEEIRLELR
jgi:hypothetical protein